MAEFIAGGYDFSPLIEDGGFVVKKTNIYEDIPGMTEKIIAGVKTEIEIKLSNLLESTVAEIKDALSVSMEPNGTIPAQYVFCGEEAAINFNAPEITLTAVTERSDGIYWNMVLRFVSEGYFSGDRL
jgi:hypothetical protein